MGIRKVRSTGRRGRIKCPMPWGYLLLNFHHINPCCYQRHGTGIPYNSLQPDDPFNSPGMVAVRRALLAGSDAFCSPTCSHLHDYQSKDLEEIFKQTYRNAYIDPEIYRRAVRAFVNGDVYLDGPLRIRLRVGSACNHECVFCQEIHQAAWKQDEAVYEMIERCYLGTLQEIELVGGEPLIAAKDLISRMDSWRERLPYFRFILITNGVLLDHCRYLFEEWQELILYISVCAATRETYKRVHQRDDFDRVCNNIKMVQRRRNAAKRHTFIKLVFVYLRMNYLEIPAYIELCHDLGIDHIIVRAMIYLPLSSVDQSETIMPGDPEVTELQLMRRGLEERCKEYGIGFEMKMPGAEGL